MRRLERAISLLGAWGRAVIRVLVIGAGGLGCPALLALGEAGVDEITLLEPDRVELSNLHRQVLYTEADIGEPKARVAARVLGGRFPNLRIRALESAFSAQTQSLVSEHTWVLDGTDGLATKLAIADACVDAGVPFVYAGVVGTDGQVLGVLPGRSACPRCLFDEVPPPGAAPTCAELGIVGPVAGIVAARQVEVGLSLAGAAPHVDELWSYDGLRDRARTIPLRRQADCRGCGARRDQRGDTDQAEPVGVERDAPVLDLAGLVCPATYVATARALERLAPGDSLWVHLTSDEAQRNVPASARAAGHRVLARRTDGRVHRVLLQRRAVDDGGRDS